MALDVAPGAEEELSGEAFSGLQAKLLDSMLAAIGCNRENACLAYVSPWRPPGGATMTPQQAAIFAPFARRRVELARPEVLLLFGEAPARVMLATSETGLEVARQALRDSLRRTGGARLRLQQPRFDA